MKDITLKITGKQYMDDGFKDSIEFVTEGKLYERGAARYLLYEESELSGMPGCKTRLRFEGDRIKMSRTDGDKYSTEMEFAKGERYHGYYDTAFGTLELEVVTNDIINNLTEEGTGSIDIDYHLSLKGLIEGRNKLNIQVM